MFNRFTPVVLSALLVIPLLISCSPGPSSITRSAKYVVADSVTEGNRWRDNRFFATKIKTDALATDGIHDPANAAITTLQEPADALSAFPLDRRGAADWVKAIDLGIIEPRADLKGQTQMTVLDLDIMFKDTGQMPWVKFPHIAHTKWLACSNCHPDIFVMKKVPTIFPWMACSLANIAAAAMARFPFHFGFASAVTAFPTKAPRHAGMNLWACDPPAPKFSGTISTLKGMSP